jgi:hypothetical protein
MANMLHMLAPLNMAPANNPYGKLSFMAHLPRLVADLANHMYGRVMSGATINAPSPNDGTNDNA